MKRINKHHIILLLSICTLGFVSCYDAWEEHYATQPAQKSEQTLYQYIRTQAELSKFAALLEATGYDSVLSRTQTYTVWAPLNAALEGSEGWELSRKTEVVKNHITRFAHPTSGLQSKTIFMLDKKFVTFARVNGGFSLGGKNLLVEQSKSACVCRVEHAPQLFPTPQLPCSWGLPALLLAHVQLTPLLAIDKNQSDASL